MKKERKTLQFLIIPLACAQALTWQGCTQEDTPMATPPAMPHTTYELHLHDTAATRVSVDENSYRFRWDAGDQITVWMGSDFDTTQPYAFSTADGGMGSAHFKYTGPETDNRTCFALYPANGQLTGHSLTWEVPATGIVQADFNQSKHLHYYRAMASNVVNQAESSTTLPNLRFRQLTGLLIFRLTNNGERPRTISAIRIESTRPTFYTQGQCDAGSETATQTSGAVSTVSLKLGNGGLELPADKKTYMAYLPILPTADLQGAMLNVVIETPTGELNSFTLNGEEVGDADGNGKHDFTASYYYLFNLSLKESDLIWDMDNMVGWQEGETVEIPVN